MSEERTEKATPHRRKQAREKGDRVRSRELAGAAGTLAGVLALGGLTERWAGSWAESFQAFLALGVPKAWEEGQMEQTMLAMRHGMVVLLYPLFLVFAFAAGSSLLAGLAQGGGAQIRAEALQPSWERINPVANLKNTFSLRGVTRMAKSLVPGVCLLTLAIRKIEAQSLIPPMSVERLPSAFAAVYAILLDTAFILFAWSAVDYLVEWRSWEKRLKMSRQDLREEYKQTEGNPQISGKIRALRRQMRRQRMKADVSRASVVITNPTHFAVALSFDFDTMEPPRVLAKGRDLIAEQIKSDAHWAGVPIVENPPLARSLYRHVEEGHAIPYDLYAAVAAILAWLYRQQVEERILREQAQRKAGGKTARSPGAAPVTSAAPLPVPLIAESGRQTRIEAREAT
ncbi:MAG TPA: EscU/YscU/HrcU family type III secretion system export apparatus switch protein [Acidobacteriaceae bacterium]|nr:EscU/YscU/HrcU family type III secretion system export apparatus switch protein [Acidobacteriaceae bacterium]